MNTKEYLKTLCQVYKFEQKNPVNKDEDEFKWYMWNVERAAFQEAAQMSDEDAAEECFKDYIFAKIDEWASVPFGGDAKPYRDKYFAY